MMIRKIVAAAAAALACSGAMAANPQTQTFTFNDLGGTLVATGFTGLLSGGELLLSGGGLLGSTVDGFTYFSNVHLDGGLAGVTQTSSFTYGLTTYGTAFSFNLGGSATSHTISYDLIQAGTSHATATVSGSYSAAPVPEPESYAMLLAGLGALGFMGRRRNKATKA